MKDEPRSAAMAHGRRYPWGQERKFHWDEEQKCGTEVGKHPEDEYEADPEPCSSSTGCAMVFRPNPDWWQVEDWSLYEDDPSDNTYEYQSASDNEEAPDMGIDDNTGPTEKDEWLFKVTGPDPPEFDTEFLPLNTPLGMPLYFSPDNGWFEFNNEAWEKQSRFEHIAGPDCQYSQAYFGKNISVEEMRGCHTVQGILQKPPASKSRLDDFDFERGSNYFLTGLAEEMPSSGSWLDFYLVRYGASDHIDAETNFVLETVSSIPFPSQ